MTTGDQHVRKSPRFQTTRWTMVLSARDCDDPKNRSAMDSLCCGYWYPLYAYVRRSGYSAEDSCDLTQAFFERFFQADYLRTVSPEKGRFRSFLLVAMKRFLAKEWRKGQTIKRGGGMDFVPIDSQEAERRYDVEPIDDESPEVLFDRRWALALLDRALARLRRIYDRNGKIDVFEALKGNLGTASDGKSYADAGAAIGLSEGAARVAAHRLRQRFRKCFYEEVLQTVPPHHAEKECREILAILSR